MAKGIITTVEIWSNVYSVRYERFGSIRKAMNFVRSIAYGGYHFIGIERSDRKGFCYITH